MMRLPLVVLCGAITTGCQVMLPAEETTFSGYLQRDLTLSWNERTYWRAPVGYRAALRPLSTESLASSPRATTAVVKNARSSPRKGVSTVKTPPWRHAASTRLACTKRRC